MSDKYKNGKIYTLRCKNDDTLIYVGSTVQPLFKRWHQHKKNSINEKSIKYNYALYKKIRETNIEDWYIEYTYTYIYMYVCIHTCVCTHTYVCMYVCVHTYECMYVLYVCVHVLMYIEII